jgi:hypothetical protein
LVGWSSFSFRSGSWIDLNDEVGRDGLLYGFDEVQRNFFKVTHRSAVPQASQERDHRSWWQSQRHSICILDLQMLFPVRKRSASSRPNDLSPQLDTLEDYFEADLPRGIALQQLIHGALGLPQLKPQKQGLKTRPSKESPDLPTERRWY